MSGSGLVGIHGFSWALGKVGMIEPRMNEASLFAADPSGWPSPPESP